MKQYMSFLRLSIVKGLQYKTAAIAGIATQFCFGLLFIMIFEAFYTHQPNQPISLEQIIQMVWLQQSFLVFIMLWYRDAELYNMITSGNICYELCRPTNLYHHWYARLLGQRLAGAFLRSLPILIGAMLMPEPYKLHPPVTLTALLLFVITMLLALIIIVGLSMLIYVSIFHTLSPAGSFLIMAVFGEFFAGLTIPIPLMPLWLQNICNLLPFRYASDLPFRIYNGHIHTQEAIISVVIQLIWIVIIIGGGKWWMNRSLRKVIVLGG